MDNSTIVEAIGDVAVGNSAPNVVSEKSPLMILTPCSFAASGSVLAVVLGVVSVRNGLFLSNAFPLRSSLEPEFAIEFVSAAFSVFVALTPTVDFPFVVSTAGASFFSSGFVCNFVVAVTNLACACDNSACVFALFKAVLASSKTVLRLLTLSSVLVAYAPLANFPSTSLIKSVNSFLSRVSTF